MILSNEKQTKIRTTKIHKKKKNPQYIDLIESSKTKEKKQMQNFHSLLPDGFS